MLLSQCRHFGRIRRGIGDPAPTKVREGFEYAPESGYEAIATGGFHLCHEFGFPLLSKRIAPRRSRHHDDAGSPHREQLEESRDARNLAKVAFFLAGVRPGWTVHVHPG